MVGVPRVAVVLETFSEHGRSIMRGVASYVERGHRWDMYAAPLGRNESKVLKAASRADGIITYPYSDELVEVIRQAGVPTVVVHYRGDLPISRVRSNAEKIVTMAIDHFLEQGFRHFAFFGVPERKFSIERCDAFQRALASRGYACSTFNGASIEQSSALWYAHDNSAAAWLRSLPKPVAVLAANDMAGQELLFSAWNAGIRVPDDVTVVGVDNDELICRFTTPPMSSIDIGGERIGFEAAALLDRLLKGERFEAQTVLVDPERLIVRQSSDVLAVDDAHTALAIRFIRQNTSRILSVDDVLREVPIARRTLEKAFKKHLGRSIYEEIIQSRIRRAKQFLIETDMTIPEITAACGFSDRNHLGLVFMKRTGHSPGAFRRQFRKPR